MRSLVSTRAPASSSSKQTLEAPGPQLRHRDGSNGQQLYVEVKPPTALGDLMAFLAHEVTMVTMAPPPHAQGLVTLWLHYVALGHIHPGHPRK